MLVEIRCCHHDISPIFLIPVIRVMLEELGCSGTIISFTYAKYKGCTICIYKYLIQFSSFLHHGMEFGSR